MKVARHAMQLPTNRWAVLAVPTVGGLLCGLLVYGLAPEAEGHGTDAMVRAFHRLGGRIRGRVPFVKAAASIITIGTGGSAGREGPIAQIGAGFGSFLATKLGLGEQERRLLMLSGGAGGIGAIFRARWVGPCLSVKCCMAPPPWNSPRWCPASSHRSSPMRSSRRSSVKAWRFDTPADLALREHR